MPEGSFEFKKQKPDSNDYMNTSDSEQGYNDVKYPAYLKPKINQILARKHVRNISNRINPKANKEVY